MWKKKHLPENKKRLDTSTFILYLKIHKLYRSSTYSYNILWNTKCERTVQRNTFRKEILKIRSVVKGAHFIRTLHNAIDR